MANVNAPFGAKPIGTFNGGPYNGRTTRYWIPSTDGTAYGIGSIVKSLNNSDASGIPGVIIAGGTDTVRGIIVGLDVGIGPFLPGNVPDLSKDPQATASLVQIPATKARDYYVLVADDPECMFMMQLDSAGTNSVASKVNNNASFTATAPPTNQAFSAGVIGGATINTTQALNIRLMGLAQIPGNVFGAYAIYVCKFNQHELMGNTAGI